MVSLFLLLLYNRGWAGCMAAQAQSWRKATRTNSHIGWTLGTRAKVMALDWSMVGRCTLYPFSLALAFCFGEALLIVYFLYRVTSIQVIAPELSSLRVSFLQTT